VKVIPFPKRKSNSYTTEVVYDHLMNVAQNTLDRIADEISDVARNKQELREQIIFVLEKLSFIADDLKSAAGDKNY